MRGTPTVGPYAWWLIIVGLSAYARPSARTTDSASTSNVSTAVAAMAAPYNRPVAEREVKLSSADRVLFPDDGITKGDLFAYYQAVAPVIVAHLRDRPFTMKRYREGAAGS